MYEISGGIPRIVNVVCDNALVIGYAMGKKRLNADVIDEAAADLIATEGAPEVVAATQRAGGDVGSEAAARSRWMSPRGVMAVVAAALVIGLLSVGRTLWKGGFLAGAGPALEVVQPGISDQYPPAVPGREPMAPVQRPVVAERRPLREYPEYVRPGEQFENPRRAEAERYDGRATRPERGTERLRDEVAIGDLAEPPEPEYAPSHRMREPARVGEAVREVPSVEAEARRDLEARRDAEDRRAVEARRDLEARRDAEDRRAVEARRAADARVEVGRAAEDEPRVALAPAPAPIPEAREERSERVTLPAWDDEADAAVEIDVPLVDAPVPAPEPEETEPPDSPTRMRLALNRYKYVQVVPEDSISQIAIRHYGQASPTILDLMKLANPKIKDINRIKPGQTLRLPQLDQGLVLLKQSDGQYGLLLSSLTSRGRAQEIRTALRRQGFGARVSTASLGAGRTVWRVIVGDLENRDVALQIGSDLQLLLRRDRRISALAEQDQ